MELGIVDWSELPDDIIETISKRLTIYVDYLRFRCVCRRWNSPLPKIPFHIPPQLPWLVLSPSFFFNLSTKKIHRINLPLPFGPTRICGSSHGWLVILNYTPELILLNPITRATISLPSLQTFPDLVANLSDYNNNIAHLIKVVLSSSPSLSDDDDDFVALAILDTRDFAFCKKGYNSWVRLNHGSKKDHRWLDAVYNKGSFFVTSTGGGTIAVCDIEGSKVFLHENISFSNYFNNNRCYTVLVGEDMLLVKQIDDMRCIVHKFHIFKMNWNVLKWEKIQTLGEYSLFIGKNSSLCFSVADFVGCYPNCIYFTDNLVRKRDFYFGIYNLSNRRINSLPCYPKHLKYLFEYPVWVTPNPR